MKSALSSFLLLITTNAFFVHSFSVHKWTPVAPTFTRQYENNVRTTVLYAEETDAVADQKPLPKVYIEYCTGCRWMLRAAWLGQELLTTFQDELHSVTLIPSRPPAPGGLFVSAHLNLMYYILSHVALNSILRATLMCLLRNFSIFILHSNNYDHVLTVNGFICHVSHDIRYLYFLYTNRPTGDFLG